MTLNYVEALVDEIALEGLDGITLQALWVRLSTRRNFDFFLDEKSKNFLWNIVKKLKNIELFILPKARADLILPDDNEESEPGETDLQLLMKQLYPLCIIDSNGIKGSCSTYELRTPAPKNIISCSVEDCNDMWGGRLVLVASQETRNFVLMGNSKYPSSDLAANHYCVLERIGRARYYGVFTYGPGSIQDVIKEDPRSHFYIRKKFLEQNLITKQFQSVRIKNVMSNCYLLHLSRFYVLTKSASTLRQEKIMAMLRAAPEHFVEYDIVREALSMHYTAFKKLMSAMHNKGHINSHARVTYRTVHPDAPPSEWRRKNSGVEKTIRVVVLGCNEKEAEAEPSIDDEVGQNSDDDEPDETNGKGTKGFLDMSHRTLERTVMHQAYRAIENAGPDGMSQSGLGKLLGLGRLDRRLTCRQLMKEGTISVKMQDVGRQRVAKYYAVRLQMKDMKFEKEKLKFVELVGDSKVLEKLLSRDARNPNLMIRRLREDAEELPAAQPPDTVEALPPPTEQPVPSTSQASNAPRETILEASEEGIDLEPDDQVDPLNTSDSLLTGSNLSTTAEDESLMTYRILRRINIILAEVLKSKVIDDISKFYKLIQDEEKEEGYEYKVDRKSLYRLIGKLQREKCVKLFKAVIKSDDKKRTLTFVCSPDINKDHSSIQCAIEQAKFRVFNIPEVKPPMVVRTQGDPLLDQESIILSVQEIQKLNKEASSPAVNVKSLKRELSNRYGHCPKFVRMRLLHKLLFYLSRCYLGSVDTDQEQAALTLQTMGHKVPDDLPRIYYANAVDWKMFVPPLPKHEGWPDGWTILCDVVLRIPLSVFVRIMWVRYVIPGLDTYMSHPIKQHYLLGNLPRFIRSNLLARRKFLFTLFETAQRLCFMGLLQFGPQRLKEKDQLFVYVNKNASIVDTTPSKVGYFQVSTDITYEKKSYIFSNTQDVDKYWCDLFTTSVCTQLGGKAGQEGKEIVLESLENKVIMQEACRVRTPAQALMYDDGSIPGDHLGASGLDSAFFAHLKRNWCSKYLVLNSSAILKEQVSSTLSWDGEFSTLSKEPVEVEKVIESKGKGDKVKKTVQKVLEFEDSPEKTRPGPSGVKNKPTFVPRPRPGENRIKKRQICKTRFKKKVEEDPTVQHFYRGRVSWAPEEDVYLILCKVAGIFLSQDSSKTPIKGSLVAHVLHKCVPSAKLKKSDQCLRRMNYLYNRSESAQLDIAMCLEESRQDPVILERFWNFQQNLRARKFSQEKFEAEMDRGFEELVDMLKEKYRSIPEDLLLDTPIPDTLAEFHARFSVVNPYLSLRQRGRYTEPTTLEQVYFNVIITLIFSSLGTSADKTNYSFQLLNVYQQYPDKWLRAAINKLRTDQMVSSKKLFARSLKHRNNQLPLTSTPFQLAIYYFHMIQSKYQYETFHEAWAMLKRLREAGDSEFNLDSIAESGGRTAALFEGIAAGLVEMRLQMPDQIIMLDFDPTIADEEKQTLQQAYEKVLKNTDKLEDWSKAETLTMSEHVVEEMPEGERGSKRCRLEDEQTEPDQGKETTDTIKEQSSAKRLRLEEASSSDQNMPSQSPSIDAPEAAVMPATPTHPTPLTAEVASPVLTERDIVIRANVAARMEFYATRDDLKDKRGVDEGKDQRARLAMKPCEVICKSNQSNFPLDETELKNIINSIKSRSIVTGESYAWEKVQLQYLEVGASTADLETAAALVAVVKDRQQLGATTSLLRDWFHSGSGKMSLASHLVLLTSQQVLLRVGVTTVHYVHWSFKQAWLINSAKVKRLQRESQLPLDAVMLDLSASGDSDESELILPDHHDQESSIEQPEQAASSEIAEKVRVTKIHECSRSLIPNMQTAEEVTKQLEKNCGEKVLVAIRPWVRIDGSLNRRVLDRLLGAMLCHLLYHPGTTLKLLQQRFCPALQPFHTFELLEILHMIGCVKVSAMLPQEQVTLFSKPVLAATAPSDFTEDESSIFVEPVMDAILRMAQFIGDKNYSADFLEDIKIRPFTEAPSQLLIATETPPS